MPPCEALRKLFALGGGVFIFHRRGFAEHAARRDEAQLTGGCGSQLHGRASYTSCQDVNTRKRSVSITASAGNLLLCSRAT